ncbi:hypothetical protein [Streptomyces sp. NPDC096013]|uniref:hypothetical protein n=1 Tax=Streptomyces sp. NPDC096013 TaxID=3366069 RepID=UPI00381B714E
MMFVRTERLPQTPQEADGRHLIEWTVDEDIHWGQNTRPAAAAVTEPELRQEANRVTMRRRLHLTDDGAAYLEMGRWSVLFDLASPIPGSVDESWVEISVGSEALLFSANRPDIRRITTSNASRRWARSTL